MRRKKLAFFLNKQPDVDADNIGSHGRHYCGDVKVVCSLSSSGEHGRKGAFVAFGNTESFYRNMVMGHGPYCEEGEGGGMVWGKKSRQESKQARKQASIIERRCCRPKISPLGFLL